jgi:pilus assembly protein CpaF
MDSFKQRLLASPFDLTRPTNETALPNFSLPGAPPAETTAPPEVSFQMKSRTDPDFWSAPGQETTEEGKDGAGLLSNETLSALKKRIHEKYLKDADVAVVSRLSRETLTEQVRVQMELILDAENLALTQKMRDLLVEAVVDEILGLGPIEPLLADPEVTEVMVNGPKQIYVEKKGKLILTDTTFEDDTHVLRIIERIVAPLGRRIDESSPMVDARLKDGSRVNAIIPPLAVKGPSVTIRKFSKIPYQIEDMIRFGTLTQKMATFLEACVNGRMNIIVSGGTGSGKTTTLGVLSSYIPEGERIVTIEDAAELQLRQPHVVTLETRPANLEGKGEITIRHLVKNSLRMRPDRIVIGEVRGGEALDMLQAMNTGHDGSLATLHANSPRDVMARLETMVLMAGTELPVRAIREQIASAVQLIVHQSRLRDGSRKITHITEVQKMEGDVIVLQDIFHFEWIGMDENGKVIGEMKPTGLRPLFLPALMAQGISLPQDIFL